VRMLGRLLSVYLYSSYLHTFVLTYLKEKEMKKKSKIEKVKGLTPVETGVLAKVLDYFERTTKYDTGVGKISGGFAFATVPKYDNKHIDIELQWGIKSDCQDTCYVEDWKLKRSVLSSINSIKKMVEQIEN
jgi:hypothetical protein